MNNDCLLFDGTIFIGLTSMPLGKNQEIIDSLEKLEKNLRSDLNKKIENLTDLTKSEELLDPKSKWSELHHLFYKSRRFYLFGRFDLASICLVEGYNYPVRKFSQSEFNLYGNQDFISIDRHNILGPTPRISSNNTNIVGLREIFHPSASKKFPLIALVRLKIHDLLLFHGGVEVVRSIIVLINQTLKSNKKHLVCFDFIVLEDYGWSELTLVLFGNSFMLFSELILSVRNLTSVQITSILSEINTRFKGVNQAINLKNKSLNIFSDTHSMFGFDHDLFDNSPSDYFIEIDPFDKVWHKINITHRPRYAGQLIDELKLFNKKYSSKKDKLNYAIKVGKSDLIFLHEKSTTIPTSDLIDRIISFKQFVKKRNIHQLVSSTFTEISILGLDTTEDHKSLSLQASHLNLEELSINPQKLSNIKNALNEIKVPHVLKEETLSVFALFNNYIVNELTYSNFIELRTSIKYLEKIIVETYERFLNSGLLNPQEFNDRLQLFTRAFHFALYNRTLGSYNKRDQYDDSMYFNIRSQSLISAFDILYKNISCVLGNHQSFVFVESDKDFTISEFALRLNYFHLFNPELLCAVLFQETANQIDLIKRVSPECEILFLFNRRTDSDQNKTRIKYYFQLNGVTPYSDQDLLELFDPEYFEHLFSDIIGYKMFYWSSGAPRRYTKNYIFWSWGFFATDIKHFEKKYNKSDYSILEITVLDRLIRHLTVLWIYSRYDYDNYKPNFDSRINEIINRNINSVKKFLEKFFFRGAFLTWLDKVKELGNNLAFLVFEDRNFDSDIRQIKSRLLNGEVITYCGSLHSKDANIDLFLQSRNLLLAYLLAFESQFDNDKEVKILLDDSLRNSKGIFSDLLFDPRGGTYIVHPDKRRNIFRLRSAFHMSLIDLSYGRKNLLLSPFLKTNE